MGRNMLSTNIRNILLESSDEILTVIPKKYKPDDYPFSETAISARKDESIYHNDIHSANDIIRRYSQLKHNKAFKSADAYTRKTFGIGYSPEIETSPSSLHKQAAIGKAFQLLADGDEGYKKSVFAAYKKHHPELIKESGARNYDELTKAAYNKLQDETKAQFSTIPVKMQYHYGHLSYHNSTEMARDIHGHGNMTVYRGGDEHDHLNDVDKKTGLNSNEMFRAIHDYYGHAIHNNPFGAKGEEIAWDSHHKMFSPLARLAMTAETRGQNSFVNYSGINTDNITEMEKHRKEKTEAIHKGDLESVHKADAALRNIGSNWNYAPQKSGILPPEMNEPKYDGKIPSYIKGNAKETPYDTKKDVLGLVKIARISNTVSHQAAKNKGQYDSNQAKKDFAKLLSLHGYSTMTAEPHL